MSIQFIGAFLKEDSPENMIYGWTDFYNRLHPLVNIFACSTVVIPIFSLLSTAGGLLCKLHHTEDITLSSSMGTLWHLQYTLILICISVLNTTG